MFETGGKFDYSTLVAFPGAEEFIEGAPDFYLIIAYFL
jgi:hypothetical protein